MHPINLAAITWLLLALIALFLAVLGYAMLAGDFWQNGRTLLALPWGIMTLVDLYMGFVIFAAFIMVTEHSKPRAFIWICLLMVLGNLITALYLLRWLHRHWSGS